MLHSACLLEAENSSFGKTTGLSSLLSVPHLCLEIYFSSSDLLSCLLGLRSISHFSAPSLLMHALPTMCSRKQGFPFSTVLGVTSFESYTGALD